MGKVRKILCNLRFVRRDYFRKSGNPAEMIEILVLENILCILSHESRIGSI